jgi:hypothetical protein
VGPAEDMADGRRDGVELRPGAEIEASVELAQRQHDAGNISDLDYTGEQALHEQIRLDLARSEGEILVVRERLIRLLGLSTRCSSGFTSS